MWIIIYLFSFSYPDQKFKEALWIWSIVYFYPDCLYLEETPPRQDLHLNPGKEPVRMKFPRL